MSKRRQLLKYLISDYLTAGISWTLFFIFRKIYIETPKFGYEIPVEFGSKYYLGLFFIPLYWVIIYYSTGYYKSIYRKSRLKELGQTLMTVIVGVVVIFFTLILDDTVLTYRSYYYSFIVLLALQFILTYVPRLIITTYTAHKIQNRHIGFNTLLIGSNEKAVELYLDIEKQPKSAGNKFIGFINVHNNTEYLLCEHLPRLGDLNNIADVIKKYKAEEVIIAIESPEHDKIEKIINRLQEVDVIIKVIPDMYDILTGKVKMASLFGVPLIQISHDLMPIWMENLKRIFDVVVSAISLILLSPVYISLAIGVKSSSKGPVLYNHERIGRYGKPFTIYKFRSMYIDSEKNGPELSSKNDSRITKFGFFIRKLRLDELPQFYNVLIGDMSLVGPRPERQYYIDRIVEKAPHYFHLLKLRPGITSWGQVKFGYAENVDEMIERLKYDIIYIENVSLYVDFKILIYTILTVLKGSGK